MGKRAKGRSLADFPNLNTAEKKILAAAASGTPAKIGETRPEAESDAGTVRAAFLRFLALGGDAEAPVHEAGLWVQGAWITGTLDLSDAEIARGLRLIKCRFEQAPKLFDAQIRGLFSLAGSKVPGLEADRLNCHSSVFLRDGFTATGEIRLLGATIGGDLACTKGTFENPKGQALTADRIKVGGNVFMGTGFQAQGEIHLLGATIGGNLDCTGGAFENRGKEAIVADDVKVGGSVFMDDKFCARGEVRLLGATIDGDLSCHGGNFGSENPYAINCQGLRVSGTFFFDRVKIASGSVDLTAVHVAHLVDDRDSWPENIMLDGFVCDSFAGNAPTTAKDRLAWLDKQRPDHSGAAKNPRAFRPQPWLQLRKVLREQGHLEDSRLVAIAFENRKRACGVIGEIFAPAKDEAIVTRLAQRLQSCTCRVFHWVYGCLIGYGYRPIKLFWILVAVWILSTALFFVGANNRVFGPTDPQIFQNTAYDSCNPEKKPRVNWTRCQTFPRAYPAFYPPLYALDVLLPVGKLGQQDHWAPLDPRGARTSANKALAWATEIAVWGETPFGWIAGVLLVATVTGLAKRHDE